MTFEIRSVEFRGEGINSLKAIRCVEFHCIHCEFDWKATEGTGPGKFIFLSDGAIRVTCQFCSREEDILKEMLL